MIRWLLATTVGLQVLTDFQHIFFLRMKEAATKSTPLARKPKMRSRLFLGQGPAVWMETPGRLTPFVLAQITVVQHLADDFTLGDFDDVQTDQAAVIHQDAAADAQVVGEVAQVTATLSCLPTTVWSVVKVKVAG